MHRLSISTVRPAALSPFLRIMASRQTLRPGMRRPRNLSSLVWTGFCDRRYPPCPSGQVPSTMSPDLRYFASATEVTQLDSEGFPESSSEAGDKSSNKTDQKKRHRRRRRKIMKPKRRERKPLDETALQQQLEELFDEVAPSVLVNRLEMFISKLEGNQTRRKRQRIVDKTVKSTTEGDEDEEDPNNWMHSKILSFLDILPLHARPVQSIQSPAMHHQKSLDETKHILKRAREKATNSDILSWSKQQTSQVTTEQRQQWHAKKTDGQLEHEAQEFAEILSRRLPSKKFNSLKRFFDDYVRVADDKRKKISVPIEEKPSHSADKGDKNPKLQKRTKTVGIRLLFNNVERKLGGHMHLIAPELAKFFYFDPPEIASETESLAKKEPSVLESEKNWEEAKYRFVKKMTALYQKIHFAAEELDTVDSSSSVNEEDNEALVDIVEASLKENPAKTASSKSKEKSVATYTHHHVHLLFDAVVTDQYQQKEFEHSMSSSTTVFVDNLPIDITEDRVAELYSRCGPIEDVEIFNQRPDLDPGALSTTKQMALAKARRKSRVSRSKGIGRARWTRPRTPVYAMLSFSNEVATRAAAQDALRIFGMIVDGHSVRSIHAKEMTRLYLDGIQAIGSSEEREGAQRWTAMDIEYNISQVLNPDIYISLDINSSSHKKSARTRIGSCEIMFPSFEVAYDSYCKLEAGLDILKQNEPCSLNWMRTPPDAMLYWTRELGGI